MLTSPGEQQIRQLETRVMRGDGTVMETLFDLSQGRLSRIAGLRMPDELPRTMSVNHLLMAARMPTDRICSSSHTITFRLAATHPAAHH
jgi:hypothetical protein